MSMATWRTCLAAGLLETAAVCLTGDFAALLATCGVVCLAAVLLGFAWPADLLPALAASGALWAVFFALLCASAFLVWVARAGVCTHSPMTAPTSKAVFSFCFIQHLLPIVAILSQFSRR